MVTSMEVPKFAVCVVLPIPAITLMYSNVSNHTQLVFDLALLLTQRGIVIYHNQNNSIMTN